MKDAVGDRLTWSPHQRGATFVIGDADFDSEFVALVRRSTGQVELQTDHIAELHIQDLVKLAEVRVGETGPTAGQPWQNVAEDLAAIVQRWHDPQTVAVLAAWQPAAQVLAAWEPKVRSLGLHTLSDAATKLRLRMEGIAGRAVPAAVWEEFMVRCARQALEQEPDGQQPQAVVKLLEALQQLGPRVAAELEAGLVAKVLPLTSADELRLLRSAVPSKNLPTTAQFFGNSVVADLVREAFSAKSRLSQQSPLETAASAARLAADAVAKLADCELGGLANDDAMAKTLPKLEPAILGKLSYWTEAVGHLRKLLDGNPASGSRLEAIDHQLRAYRSYLDRLAKGDASKTPLVFDTNAFLHHPQVLAQLRANQVAVVPQQVVAELDRKKRDPQLAEAATQANAEIHRRREQIQFEEADLQLLPAAYRASADDQILSVVMRLKWRKPVLVTSDKNLQSKAKSLGLEARTPAELWPAANPQPAQGGKSK